MNPDRAADHDPSVRTARDAAARAIAHLAGVDTRPAAPSAEAIDALAAFDEPLPDGPSDPAATIALLDRIGAPATMNSPGSRYFGFVNGGTLPAAIGAAFLTAAWDQNAALPVMSPVADAVGGVARRWVREVLRLPAEGVEFVTGATVANAAALAAARDAVLADHGWDVQGDGLFGAPPPTVVVGERAHSTLTKSLGLIGLGRDRVVVVPADDQGRLRADRLPERRSIEGPLIVCAQAGEVNTGAFDPFGAIADWIDGDGWLHVDGAFGLWALADPGRTGLTAGLDRADSWATDGHKWLNVTYDCGLVLTRRAGDLRRTFAAGAGYLPPDDRHEAMHHTPQSSQRARQFEVWAALRSLGRSGVAELVQRTCDTAVAIAEGLRVRLGDRGVEILNDVDLNQVLVRVVDGPTTEAVLAALHADGEIWCGPTTWEGETALRISVSSWRSDPADAPAVVAAFERAIRP